MSRGVSSKGSIPSDYEFSTWHAHRTTLQMHQGITIVYFEKYKVIANNDCVYHFVPTVLKPLSAECHVIMDQSSEIVLNTPKVNNEQ